MKNTNFDKKKFILLFLNYSEFIFKNSGKYYTHEMLCFNQRIFRLDKNVAIVQRYLKKLSHILN